LLNWEVVETYFKARMELNLGTLDSIGVLKKAFPLLLEKHEPWLNAVAVPAKAKHPHYAVTDQQWKEMVDAI
jgi:hypothetical protein